MICRGCGVNKSVNEFYAGRRRCKRCVIDRVHAHPNHREQQRAFSIDHTIPISKGGPDTMQNVTTAHLKCNLDKGARLIEGVG